MLKQGLQQKLLQKLSPQQIQLIKLLEVPTIELEQRIKKEIEENPALEEGRDAENETAQDETQEDNTNDDEFSVEDYLTDDDEVPDYKLSANNYSKDDKKTEVPYSEGTSFREFLKQQLGLRDLSPEKQKLADYILGNIDDDGYLRRRLEAIVNDLAFTQNRQVEERHLHELLRTIQSFDPPGVGARDLRECLILQIDRKRQKSNSENKEILDLTRRVMKDFFNEFTKKHYSKIISRMGITENQLKEVIAEILKLNPKPGSSFYESSGRSSQQIIPDFILDVVDGKIELHLNSKNAPELRVSRTYADMLQTYSKSKQKNLKQQKEAVTFVKQKLDSAKWFIDAIKQRQNTLIVTMNAIIDYQTEYFLEGDETKLRPMILKDIADKTGLDISTISRVANSKYIQTHFGIYPLKYFFSEGMRKDSGEEVSTREIKSILQNCIDNESKRKPLTDAKLSEILQEKGYQIARRTVAKYREQLNIPVARLRKEL